MVLDPDSPATGAYRRRAVLTGLASAATLAVGAGDAAAATGGAEVPKQVYVPTVSEFENDYAGQFLTIAETPDSDVGAPEQLHASCSDVPWPEQRTIVKVGQLSDRRSDTPVAVRLPIYMDDQDAELVEDALFVINRSEPCRESFVRLNIDWVTMRSLVGKPAGPTVQEGTGGDGAGFGLLAGTAGVATALVARYLHGND